MNLSKKVITMIRILWVGDEGNTDLIQYKLPMVEAGYIVDIVETAEEALDCLSSTKYDVYIIDLLFPTEEVLQECTEFPGIEIIRKMVNEHKINPEKIMVFS